MSLRLKVLMSAYACEPGKGSEPEVGWQWALQMARFHDVTVLTRENNRPAIEQGLAALRGKQPLPEFVYHEESSFRLGIKQRLQAVKLYYLLWQRSAREVVARLHAERRFDLFHHVTFAGVRYPAAIWGHGAACVWGPIGGIESVPLALLPWTHPGSLFKEIGRNAHNLLQSAFFQVLPKRARASTMTLVSTAEMGRTFAALGFETRLMPTIGLNTQTLAWRPRVAHDGPLRLLFVGNIITPKGVDLAIRALKASGTNATFTLVGDGDYLPAMRRLTEKLGLGDRVNFVGRLPRPEVLRLYSEFDVFMFPSLHDTGGYAVIEAMFNALPVICLDCGGPAVAVQAGCGVKVQPSRPASVIAGLAAAIKTYAQDRELTREHGQAARESILRNYDWEKKGEQMNEVYKKAAAAAEKPERSSVKKAYTGIGGATHVLNRMVSFKGMAMMVSVLILVGALGFFSMSHLKHIADQIVKDTLPGLSFAGEANAYLADANRTLLFVVTKDPERRAQIHEEIDAINRRTTSFLEAYSKQTFSDEDRTNFAALLQERASYIKIRNQTLELAVAGKEEEALSQFSQSMLPAHVRVKTAGDKLFSYNIRQGEARGRAIMTACTITQVAVAVIGIFIFILGFFIGLFR